MSILASAGVTSVIEDVMGAYVPEDVRGQLREHLASTFVKVVTAAPASMTSVVPPPAPPQVAPADPTAAAQETLEDLHDTLLDFFAKHPKIGSQPWVGGFVQKVIGAVAPKINALLKGELSMEEKLQNVPKARPSPQSMEDTSMIADFGQPAQAMAKLVSTLLVVADAADDEGLPNEADRIAMILPRFKQFKAAQYEGFMNYWLANGRAFEMAWKEKRQKNKLNDNLPIETDDFNSAHKAWFEVLEEFQKSLLTNQLDFVSKYAGKKEVEKGMEGGSGAVMSGRMTDFAKDMEHRAKEEGKTIGQIYSEWLDSHKAACSSLMERIAVRRRDGSAPGVAFYEAMDEVLSAAPAIETLSLARGALVAAAEAARKVGAKNTLALASDAIKQAQFMGNAWENLSSFVKNVSGVGSGTGNTMQFGPATYYYQQVMEKWPEVVSEIRARAGRGGYFRFRLKKILNKVIPTLEKYVKRMHAAGFGREAQIPSFAQFFAGEKKHPSEEKVEQYIAQVNNVIGRYVNPQIANDIDQKIGRFTATPEQRRAPQPRQQQVPGQKPGVQAPAPQAPPMSAPSAPIGIGHARSLVRAIDKHSDKLGLPPDKADAVLWELNQLISSQVGFGVPRGASAGWSLKTSGILPENIELETDSDVKARERGKYIVNLLKNFLVSKQIPPNAINPFINAVVGEMQAKAKPQQAPQPSQVAPQAPQAAPQPVPQAAPAAAAPAPVASPGARPGRKNPV